MKPCRRAAAPPRQRGGGRPVRPTLERLAGRQRRPDNTSKRFVHRPLQSVQRAQTRVRNRATSRRFLAGTTLEVPALTRGKETTMKRTARALTTLLLLAATTSAVGCATSSGAPRDVRSSAAIATTAPSMLVSGPALLMHVDLDNAADQAVLYAVERKAGTAADCGTGPSGDSLRLHGGRTNPVNLVVPAGLRGVAQRARVAPIPCTEVRERPHHRRRPAARPRRPRPLNPSAPRGRPSGLHLSKSR